VQTKTVLCVWIKRRDASDIRPDNPAFFISGTGTRPDTGFDLPTAGYWILKIAGYLAKLKRKPYKFVKFPRMPS
jgi:hypothetical protein